MGQLQINALNASAKLKKYRDLLTSPVYVLAIILVPWFKWSYFEGTMTAAEFVKAKKSARDYWNKNYASMPLPKEPKPTVAILSTLLPTPIYIPVSVHSTSLPVPLSVFNIVAISSAQKSLLASNRSC
jgi:hypothetical protein